MIPRNYTPGSWVQFDGSIRLDYDSQTKSFMQGGVWDFDYDFETQRFTPDNIKISTWLNHAYNEPNFCEVALKYIDDEGVDGDLYLFTVVVSSVKRYYYVKDHLGSIRQTIDDNGVVIEKQDYSSYGAILTGRSMNTASSNEKYKFTEKERDKESGLDYFGARYYDSEIGRWLSVDPLADKYPGWSPYNYCVNNPLKFIDPDGKRYVDANGKQITYKISNGTITFSKNATSDFKRIAMDLMRTETGLKQLNKGRDLSQDIKFKINSEANIKKIGEGKVRIRYGESVHESNIVRTSSDGKKEYGTLKTTINIYEGSINDPRDTKHKGLNTELAIGAVAGHEIEHASQASREVEESQGGRNFNEENKPNEIEQKIIKENKEN